MTNQNSSNNAEELKAKEQELLHNERQLLPRLNIMGYFLLFFGAASFVLALFMPLDKRIEAEQSMMLSTAGLASLDDDDALELDPNDVLNFYAVSATFFIVGATCFLITWRKRRTLFPSP